MIVIMVSADLRNHQAVCSITRRHGWSQSHGHPPEGLTERWSGDDVIIDVLSAGMQQLPRSFGFQRGRDVAEAAQRAAVPEGGAVLVHDGPGFLQWGASCLLSCTEKKTKTKMSCWIFCPVKKHSL